MTEIRKRPLLGTRAHLYAIMLDGIQIYEQVGPFSEDEIESRVRSHLHPTRIAAYLTPSFVPGARGTSKSYGAKGGKAGRRPKAAAGAEPWTQTEDE